MNVLDPTNAVGLIKSGGLKDQYFSSVSVLAHFDGTNGAVAPFVNNSLTGGTATLTAAAGTPTISTTQSVFGGSSLLCDAAEGVRIGGVGDTSLDFGSADWTVEFRVRFTDVTGNQILINRCYEGGAGSKSFIIYKATDGTLHVGQQHGGVNTDASIYSWNPVINQWYAVAMVRSGANVLCFMNGTQVGTLSAFTIDVNSGSSNIGCQGAGGLPLIGFMDEVRVTKGVARYTGASYTLATSRFPNR